MALAVAGEAWSPSRQQMKDEPRPGREALCRAPGRYEPLVVLGHCTSLCADVDPLGCALSSHPFLTLLGAVFCMSFMPFSSYEFSNQLASPRRPSHSTPYQTADLSSPV